MSAIDNKTSAPFNVVASVSDEELLEIQDQLETFGLNVIGNWDVVVKYNGDIEAIAQLEGGNAQIISEQYAVISVPRENVDNLIQYTEVEYIEFPRRLVYTIVKSMVEACVRQVQDNPPYRLKGDGVLVGIVDSGITYSHPDFRNEDGTTRIVSLWDQTIEGNPPEGFKFGTEYTREDINLALEQSTRQEQLAIVPSVDTIGHGTHVAGIAAGNGRTSEGRYVGAAPESDLIIVKLGSGGDDNLVRSVEIMLGVKYVIEKAQELEKPVAVNLSMGMNDGSHDGRSLMEQYLDDVAQQWKANIIVGAGNEGDSRTHTSGTVEQGGTSTISFQMGSNVDLYQMYIWKSFIDTLEFQIIDPAGNSTPRISYPQGARNYTLGNTKIYTSFGGPSPLNGDEEFYIFFENQGTQGITEGIWQIVIYGIDVIDGRYDAWGLSKELAGDQTFMLNPIANTTITTPATARNVISVGAYNAATNQIAPFSGIGYARNDSIIKPDLVAPGVDIVAASNTGGYKTLSGTSMAAPHVTGATALLMEWGIVNGNNPFLYGENLKAYLLRGAKKDVPNVAYPNPVWGYGKLCAKNSLDILRRQQIIG